MKSLSCCNHMQFLPCRALRHSFSSLFWFSRPQPHCFSPFRCCRAAVVSKNALQPFCSWPAHHQTADTHCKESSWWTVPFIGRVRVKIFIHQLSKYSFISFTQAWFPIDVGVALHLLQFLRGNCLLTCSSRVPEVAICHCCIYSSFLLHVAKQSID